MRAERELPVVWAVAKGSLLNKLILVPAALGISAVAPELIGPVLILGGAIRTDFILSAEIIVIALGSVAGTYLAIVAPTLIDGFMGLVAGAFLVAGAYVIGRVNDRGLIRS